MDQYEEPHSGDEDLQRDFLGCSHPEPETTNFLSRSLFHRTPNPYIPPSVSLISFRYYSLHLNSFTFCLERHVLFTPSHCVIASEVRPTSDIQRTFSTTLSSFSLSLAFEGYWQPPLPPIIIMAGLSRSNCLCVNEMGSTCSSSLSVLPPVLLFFQPVQIFVALFFIPPIAPRNFAKDRR